MKKPTKYLAWDTIEKKIKKLVEVKALDFSQWWVQTGLYPSEGERNSFENQGTDRHILLDFIGVTDKKGNEIYSDFILKHDYGHVGRITWVQEHCAYMILVTDGENSKYVYIESDGSLLRQWEIIGDMYTSPELMP